MMAFSPVRAQVPNLINYQGTLSDADGNPVPDGVYEIEFNIYDAAYKTFAQVLILLGSSLIGFAEFRKKQINKN